VLRCDPDRALDLAPRPGTFAEYGAYLAYVAELQQRAYDDAAERARMRAEAVGKLDRPGPA
jgi:hypothetical protein